MKQKLFDVFVRLVLAWVVFAFSFQVYMLTLNFTNPKLASTISKELTWKLDGTFSK